MGSDRKAWTKLLDTQDEKAAERRAKREDMPMSKVALESLRARSRRVAKTLQSEDASATLERMADNADDLESAAALGAITDLVSAGAPAASDGPNARAEAKRMRPVTDAPTVGAKFAERLHEAGIKDVGALAWMAIHEPEKLKAFRGVSKTKVSKIAEWALEHIPLDDVPTASEERACVNENCDSCAAASRALCEMCQAKVAAQIEAGAVVTKWSLGHPIETSASGKVNVRSAAVRVELGEATSATPVEGTDGGVSVGYDNAKVVSTHITIKCARCGAGGQIECPDCDGGLVISGEGEVYDCNGQAWVDCPDCDGKGEHLQEHEHLAAPTDTGEQKKNLPESYQFSKCERCGIAGATPAGLTAPDYSTECPRCDGKEDVPEQQPTSENVNVDDMAPARALLESLQKPSACDGWDDLVGQIRSISDWECPGCGASYGGAPNPDAKGAVGAVQCPACGATCAQRLVLENQRLSRQLASVKAGHNPTEDEAFAVADEIMEHMVPINGLPISQVIRALHDHGVRSGAATAATQAAGHLKRAGEAVKVAQEKTAQATAYAIKAKTVAEKALAVAPGLTAKRFTLVIGGRVTKGGNARHLREFVDKALGVIGDNRELVAFLAMNVSSSDVAARTIELVRETCRGCVVIVNPQDPIQALALRVLRGEATLVIEWSGHGWQ